MVLRLSVGCDSVPSVSSDTTKAKAVRIDGSNRHHGKTSGNHLRNGHTKGKDFPIADLLRIPFPLLLLDSFPSEGSRSGKATTKAKAVRIDGSNRHHGKTNGNHLRNGHKGGKPFAIAIVFCIEDQQRARALNDTNGTRRKGGRIVTAAPYITFEANRNCDSSVARLGLFCARKSAFLPIRIFNIIIFNILVEIYSQNNPDYL